jgi:hypothetical protein
VRRIALSALAATWIVEAVWLVLRHQQKGVAWGALWYPLALAMPFGLLVLTGGRQRLIASLLRLPLAFAFLQSVLDRFGVFGPPGAAGVSFGDFAHFAGFTHVLNPYLPSIAVTPLAVLVTALETSLGVGLLLGWRPRELAFVAAGLLLLFAASMTLVLSFAAQSSFGVSVLCAGAWALGCSDQPMWLGVDAWRARRVRSSPV